jgi:serine/threonine protein kinase
MRRMRCAACGFENPAAAKFCQECGAPQQRSCTGCGAALPPAANFCHDCGAAQKAGAREPSAGTAGAGATAPRLRSSESLIGGRYQVVRPLGEGSRKRVYLARDTRLGREVALSLIKTEGLDEAGRQRVRHETQAMAKLGDHRNVVTVHDVGDDGETLHIVSEYMDGGDVAGRLRAAEGGRLPVEEAIRIAAEVAAGLAHAHDHGVVHRDVKPGNVWLKRNGGVALGDFGLAVSADRTRITAEGMMVGTVSYMPPEQALGRPADARSDLYALGVTLYEMLTGHPPFGGDDAVAIISQHIHTPPVAPSWHSDRIPKPLDELVLRLLAKGPEQRPSCAAEVKKALDAIAEASLVAPVLSPDSLNLLDSLASGPGAGGDPTARRRRRGALG